MADALAGQTGQLGVATEKPDPFRTRLDAKVERVELSLRRLIAERLDGDRALVPSHVSERVQDRVVAAVRKLPDESAPRLATFDGQLGYFELRELQDAITAKSLWPRFEPTLWRSARRPRWRREMSAHGPVVAPYKRF